MALAFSQVHEASTKSQQRHQKPKFKAKRKTYPLVSSRKDTPRQPQGGFHLSPAHRCTDRRDEHLDSKRTVSERDPIAPGIQIPSKSEILGGIKHTARASSTLDSVFSS